MRFKQKIGCISLIFGVAVVIAALLDFYWNLYLAMSVPSRTILINYDHYGEATFEFIFFSLLFPFGFIFVFKAFNKILNGLLDCSEA